jgi:hypothetical protein
MQAPPAGSDASGHMIRFTATRGCTLDRAGRIGSSARSSTRKLLVHIPAQSPSRQVYLIRQIVRGLTKPVLNLHIERIYTGIFLEDVLHQIPLWCRPSCAPVMTRRPIHSAPATYSGAAPAKVQIDLSMHLASLTTSDLRGELIELAVVHLRRRDTVTRSPAVALKLCLACCMRLASVHRFSMLVDMRHNWGHRPCGYRRHCASSPCQPILEHAV